MLVLNHRWLLESEGLPRIATVGGYRIVVCPGFQPPIPESGLENGDDSLASYMLRQTGYDFVAVAIPLGDNPTRCTVFGDLYGLTEFFYRVRGDGVIVSRSITDLIDPDTKIDEISLFELYYNGYVYGHNTPYEGVSKNFPLSRMDISFAGRNVSIEHRDVVPGIGVTRSLKTCLEAVISSIAPPASRPAVFFSGGTDSTSVAVGLARAGRPGALLHHKTTEEELQLARTHSHLGTSLQIADAPLDSNVQDLQFQACAIHGNRLMYDRLARLALRLDAGSVLTGQNADSVVQMRNTRHVSLRSYLRNVALFGVSGNATRTILTRWVSNSYPRVPKRILKLYRRYHLELESAGDYVEDFLTVFMCYGNSNPFSSTAGRLAFMGPQLYERWFTRMNGYARDLASLEGLSLRQRFLILQIRGGGTGGDVRSITSAARAHGVPTYQVYSHPTLFSYFYNWKPPGRVVFNAKFEIASYAKKGSRSKALRSQPSDSVPVYDSMDGEHELSAAAFGVDDASTALGDLQSRYQWLSPASINALGRYLPADWVTVVAHMRGLIDHDFTPQRILKAPLPKLLW